MAHLWNLSTVANLSLCSRLREKPCMHIIPLRSHISVESLATTLASRSKQKTALHGSVQQPPWSRNPAMQLLRGRRDVCTLDTPARSSCPQKRSAARRSARLFPETQPPQLKALALSLSLSLSLSPSLSTTGHSSLCVFFAGFRRAARCGSIVTVI